MQRDISVAHHASGTPGRSEVGQRSRRRGTGREAYRQVLLSTLGVVAVLTLLGGLVVSSSQAQTPAEEALRLVEGPEHEGVLEVYHENEWGLVCDDRFDDRDAVVACVQLGYPTGHVLTAHSYRRDILNQPVWLDEVGCDGTETRLADCPHDGWGVRDCGRFEQAAISCSNEGDTDWIRYAENGTGAVATYTYDGSGSPTWTVERSRRGHLLHQCHGGAHLRHPAGL